MMMYVDSGFKNYHPSIHDKLFQQMRICQEEASIPEQMTEWKNYPDLGRPGKKQFSPTTID